VLRKQLHLHRRTRAAPRLPQQCFFELSEPALGRANKIRYRWRTLSHLLQNVLARNSTVHDPYPIGLSTLGFDFLAELTPCDLVRVIAGQHLEDHCKDRRCDDQSDHHLHAVAALVGGVSKPADVLGILRWRTLKIGARAVRQEHFVLRSKRRAPALGEMIKRGLFVFEQLAVALVKPVDFRQTNAFAQKISQRAWLTPMTVQTPLASQCDQA
jgi:hypothetical protein